MISRPSRLAPRGVVQNVHVDRRFRQLHVSHDAPANETIPHASHVRIPRLVRHPRVFELYVQVLIHRHERARDGEIVLQLHRHRLPHERLKVRVKQPARARVRDAPSSVTLFARDARPRRVVRGAPHRARAARASSRRFERTCLPSLARIFARVAPRARAAPREPPRVRRSRSRARVRAIERAATSRTRAVLPSRATRSRFRFALLAPHASVGGTTRAATSRHCVARRARARPPAATDRRSAIE